MNQAEFSIHTPTENVLTLDQAVLLYHGRNGGALATVHEVTTVEGSPVIGAGRAMTAQAARELAAALLQRAAHGGFLPETVLYVQGDLILWWVPPARRHIAFRVDGDHAEAFGGGERGEAVPHPGLVFAASSRQWSVWAVKGCHRPTPMACFRLVINGLYQPLPSHPWARPEAFAQRPAGEELDPWPSRWKRAIRRWTHAGKPDSERDTECNTAWRR